MTKAFLKLFWVFSSLLNDVLHEALLLPAVVQVNFSIQSFFDNFPQRGPETYFKKIFKFLHKALEIRPDLYLNLRLWNLNDLKTDQEKNHLFLDRLRKEFGVEINANVDPTFRKSKKLLQRLYLHFDSRFEWPEESTLKPRTQGTCHGTRSHIAVHSNGDVVPCCLDKEADLLLGNLAKQSLSEIMASGRFQSMKKGFENGQLVESFCQTCQYSSRF